MPTIPETIAIKRAAEGGLMTKANVFGVGLGAKLVGGKPTGDLAITVLVVNKLPDAQIPPAQRIPAEVNGVPTDVVEAVEPVGHAVIEGGLRIDARAIDAATRGTLGCVARTADVTDDQPPNVFLSCYHVLFGFDPVTGQFHGAIGNEVRQPSCSGCCEPLVGSVLRGDKDTDSAIATITPGLEVRAHTYHKAIKGKLDVRPDNWGSLPESMVKQLRSVEFQVHKFGQASDLTHGHILCVDTFLEPEPSGLHRTYQLVIKPIGKEKRFSEEGDSGSVIYDNDFNVVGLLWGGAPLKTVADHKKFTFATPIDLVEKVLKIRIATNSPVRIWRTPGPAEPMISPRAHADLVGTDPGQRLLDRYARHEPEVRDLLRTNRPFVVAWHRNHGPAMIRALLDLARERRDRLPTELDGRPWAECVEPILDCLQEQGSPALAADLAAHRPALTALGGCAYQDVLAHLTPNLADNLRDNLAATS